MKYIFYLLENLGIIGMLILTLLEYACFPLTSEVILPLFGILVKQDNYSLIGAIILSSLFSLIGCLICYFIGYYGGNILKRMKKLDKAFNKGENLFSKYGNLSASISRLLPICRTYMSFVLGMFKIDLYKYSFFSFLGIIVWNSVLISLGYYFGNNISRYIKNYELVIIFLIFLYASYKIYKNKRKLN